MKSPKTLGISTKVRNALVKVRDGLASGQYVHVKSDNFSNWTGDTDVRKHTKPVFHMECTLSNKDCGTVGCIGGWAGMEMKMSPFEASNFVYEHEKGSPLTDLFFPWEIDWSWDKITPKRAAKAIDNFLNTGDPQWSLAMKGARR